MKLYLSSSVCDMQVLKELSKKLESLGHTITRKWWENTEGNKEEQDSYAIKDKEAIEKCDLFIMYNGEKKTSGKLIEFGIAIGCGKPIIKFGNKLTSVFSCFGRSYKNIKNLIKDINKEDLKMEDLKNG